jgi:hypothetical protein
MTKKTVYTFLSGQILEVVAESLEDAKLTLISYFEGNPFADVTEGEARTELLTVIEGEVN